MRYICTQVKVSGGRATTGLDRRAISRAEKVMTLAGIDLFEGTVAQLDDRDPWVWSPCPYLKSTSSSCRRSHHGSESVFDWRHLVSHEHVRIAQKTDITHPCRYQAIMVLTQIGLVFLTKNTMPLPSKSVMLSGLLCEMLLGPLILMRSGFVVIVPCHRSLLAHSRSISRTCKCPL
jgi:RNA polymerase subunit RPABC4/transcription elongation factor Spt4